MQRADRDGVVRRALAALRNRLESMYGDRLVKVLLYGSRARGDADPESDVDVLIVLRGEVDAGREIARVNDAKAELMLEHDLVISTLFVGEDRFLHRHGPFLRNVRREGVEI